MTIDRKKFFESVKDSLFHTFSQAQVNGLNAILDDADKRNTPPKHLAYMLATAYHETSFTMQPIKEFGGTAYYTKMYDITGEKPARAKANGNTTPGDGPKYCGRGYVQLTWKNNYALADRKLGLGGKLVDNPTLMLEPDIAADTMFVGMTEGWFTGKRLSDYINDKGTDYLNARRIINGTDKASNIAAYAVKFEKALV